MKQKSILLVADATLPVPPPLYGGVERILDFLAEGLLSKGWNVSLACHQDSSSNVNRLTYPVSANERYGRLKNLGMLLSHYITGQGPCADRVLKVANEYRDRVIFHGILDKKLWRI